MWFFGRAGFEAGDLDEPEFQILANLPDDVVSKKRKDKAPQRRNGLSAFHIRCK